MPEINPFADFSGGFGSDDFTMEFDVKDNGKKGKRSHGHSHRKHRHRRLSRKGKSFGTENTSSDIMAPEDNDQGDYSIGEIDESYSGPITRSRNFNSRFYP